MSLLLKTLDNTFIGTLLAGGLIAWFGFYLYRRQKEIDIEYENIKKIRELASILFAKIQITSNKYQAQVNLYDGKNPHVKALVDQISQRLNNNFNDRFEKELTTLISEIQPAFEDLTAQLKIYGQKYDDDIKNIGEEIGKLILYLSTADILKKITPNEVNEYGSKLKQTVDKLEPNLQKLIIQKSPNMKKLWFKAKTYGWGWYPCTWQGWLILLGFIGFEVWNFMRIDSTSHSASDTLRPFIIQSFGVVLILIYICYKTGEKPRWRWG